MTMTLEQVAQAMVAPGRGILAADESSGTIKKRFDSIQTESTPDNRRDYREMLFRSTEAMKNYISGVILYDETIRQKAKDGTPLTKIIADAGSLPGIKVDAGTKPLPFCPGEVVTEGLDKLADRVKEYVGLGAKFAKWRAVIDIGAGIPTYTCIKANSQALARYAAICLEGGLVPIVEPEVLMDGDHGIERCAEVTSTVLTAVFEELTRQRCALEGIVLKPNMVIDGADARPRASANEIASHTLATLRNCVPAEVPGIAFLSGGQSGEEACTNLDAINRLGKTPWQLTYSFGRALQYPAIEIWAGDSANAAAAQAALLHRARMSSLARAGAYDPAAERTGI
jgi:fructose-bisphosphate aldolase class I